VVEKMKTIHLFGVDYKEEEYVKKFLPLVHKHFNEINKKTELANVKLELKGEKGSQWNCKSIYPQSKNAFIHQYFDDDEPVGLEGIWEQQGWGLVGFIKSGKDHLKRNIKINGFNSTKPHPMFICSDRSYGSQYDLNITGQYVKNTKIDGTSDGILVHTSNKHKFKFEGRKTYLARITTPYNNLIAPINIQMNMSAKIINEDIIEMRPPYGENVTLLKRIWPHEALSENKKNIVSAGSGTAFFIDGNGHIVTNHHVVEHSNDECKIIHNNNEYDAKIIAKDKKLDLALLKTTVKNKNFVRISSKAPSKLQRIIVAGYPHGKNLSDDLKFTSGIISALKGHEDNTSQIQIDAALNPGNSGGPIVDEESGNLVAVAVAAYKGEMTEGINFGIKASQVKDFLESNKINNRKVSLKSSAISTVLENSTVYIFFK